MSVIIAGELTAVTANAVAGDAANMSLGGGIYEPLDLEVIEMGSQGHFCSTGSRK